MYIRRASQVGMNVETVDKIYNSWPWKRKNSVIVWLGPGGLLENNVVRLNSCSSFHHHHHHHHQHQHQHHRRRRHHHHLCYCYGFKVINLAQKLFANKVISFSVDQKKNIVLANMEYLRNVILSCFITRVWHTIQAYFTFCLRALSSIWSHVQKIVIVSLCN